MSRFKPGDLVLIIGDDDCPENVGKTGVLEFFAKANQRYIDHLGEEFWPDDDQWIIFSPDLVSKVRCWDAHGHDFYWEMEYGSGGFPEKYLMHLRGDQIIESINQGERVAV